MLHDRADWSKEDAEGYAKILTRLAEHSSGGTLVPPQQCMTVLTQVNALFIRHAARNKCQSIRIRERGARSGNSVTDGIDPHD